MLERPRCKGRMRVIAALLARAPPWFEEDLNQAAFDLDAEMDPRAL